MSASSGYWLSLRAFLNTADAEKASKKEWQGLADWRVALQRRQRLSHNRKSATEGCLERERVRWTIKRTRQGNKQGA